MQLLARLTQCAKRGLDLSHRPSSRLDVLDIPRTASNQRIIFATYEVYRSIRTIHDKSSYARFNRGTSLGTQRNTLTVMSITVIRRDYNIISTFSLVWICPSGHYLPRG